MKYLFDTKAVIAFFENEPGAERIMDIIKRVEDGTDTGSISAVTLTEIYYLYNRRFGPAKTKERLDQLLSSINVVPIEIRVSLLAGSYKMSGVPMADALIAASASCTGARVVTNDPRFKKLGIGVVDFEK